MNTWRIISLCLVFLPLPAFAAGSATVPITISQITSLSFGRFAATLPGSITISPSGARTATPGIYPLSSPAWNPASFLVTGKRNTAYVITLPSSVTLSNGSNTMTIQNLVSTPSEAGYLTKGSEQLSVGGTLNVSALQSAGNYSGILPITVNYQ